MTHNTAVRKILASHYGMMRYSKTYYALVERELDLRNGCTKCQKELEKV